MNDDEDSQLAAQQQQDEMQSLLTRESFDRWMINLSMEKHLSIALDKSIPSFKHFYLKEHGLPLDSEIKDL